jgi:hypothetical protein
VFFPPTFVSVERFPDSPSLDRPTRAFPMTGYVLIAAAAFRSDACGIGQFMGSKFRVNRPQAARLRFASSLSCVSPR